MRSQKVSVDVWQMIVTSLSCLMLAFVAWIFLKLAYACIWLPKHLKEQNIQMQKKLYAPLVGGDLGGKKEN